MTGDLFKKPIARLDHYQLMLLNFSKAKVNQIQVFFVDLLANKCAAQEGTSSVSDQGLPQLPSFRRNQSGDPE